jgi:uncharacterized protein with HEPN domain
LQRDLDRLYHMVESAEAIASYLTGVERQAFLSQPILQDAVLRRLTVIGEAANKVTEGVKSRAAAIPWRRLIGFRNFVIHEYQRVDWTIVWDVAAHDLPALTADVQAAAIALAAEAAEE